MPAKGAAIDSSAIQTEPKQRAAGARSSLPADIVQALGDAGAVIACRRIRRGERLCVAGDVFRNVYVIRRGFFKTMLGDRNGHEQVTGFFMSNELLGLEALASGRHRDGVVALEESIVCPIPYRVIDDMSLRIPSLQRHFNALLSAEIVRSHGIMMLLGSLHAEERLAAFLLNLGRRFRRCGWTGNRFELYMTRAEIGSYLGLQLETVSRLFTSLRRRGLIEVDLRQVTLADVGALERLTAGGAVPAGPATAVR